MTDTPKPGTAYPPETRAKALERVAQGTPMLRIARELGVSRSTIERWARTARDRSTTNAAPLHTRSAGEAPEGIVVDLELPTGARVRVAGLDADAAAAVMAAVLA